MAGEDIEMRSSKKMRGWLLGAGFGSAVLVAAVAQGVTGDLWVHPRGETFDADVHYRGPDGALYYHAENDITGSLGEILVDGVGGREVSVELGDDLFKAASEHGGSLEPVLLYDSNGDGIMDHTLRGRMEGRRAVIDSPDLETVDFRRRAWQFGIRIDKNDGAETPFRYLASADSRDADIRYEGIAELPEVGASAFQPGLVIFRHDAGKPFDFARFVEDPTLYAEDFTQLTREEDDDDWTADGPDGHLITHLDREDLLLVRTEGNFTLDVEWGDVSAEEFLADYLDVPQRDDGCYSTLDSQLEQPDVTPVVVPNRLFYCPSLDVALFDAPPGYQIGLSAMAETEVYEFTEASTTIPDNMRLYVRQVYPRQPLTRGTGSVTRNITGGFGAAGSDLVDALRRTTTGTMDQDIHSGMRGYRASPVTAIPRAIGNLFRARPGRAFGELLTGLQSGIRAAADITSAVNNAVINPVVQATVGTFRSPEAADTGVTYFGALPIALVRNLPGSERMIDAISPIALWQHNRAFVPVDYTRTDTQLNIDRIMTTIDLVIIGAIRNHNDDSSSGGRQGDDGGGNGGGGNGGGGGGGGGGGPKAFNGPCRPSSGNAFGHFKRLLTGGPGDKFTMHPSFGLGDLPCKPHP